MTVFISLGFTGEQEKLDFCSATFCPELDVHSEKYLELINHRKLALQLPVCTYTHTPASCDRLEGRKEKMFWKISKELAFKAKRHSCWILSFPMKAHQILKCNQIEESNSANPVNSLSYVESLSS